MDSHTFLEALDALVAEKHLLKHPFYTLWTEGKLTVENLRDYAVAYYPHVAAFPRYVSAVHSQSPDPALRQELLENLIEEERGEANHPALWRRFAAAVGARGEAVTAEPRLSEVAALVETFLDATRNGSVPEGLAALYAYESQIPAVAKAKIEGLAQNYGISADRDIAFFSVHMDADVLHSQTSRDILRDLCDSPEKTAAATEATQRTLDALYGFLDSVTAN